MTTPLTMTTTIDNLTIAATVWEEADNGAYITVTDASGEVLGLTSVFNNVPFNPIDLMRCAYVQSYTSELPLSEEQRTAMRAWTQEETLRAGGDTGLFTDPLWILETNEGVISGKLEIRRDVGSDKVTDIIVGVTFGDETRVSTMDVRNGPVNFTEHYLADTEFCELMYQISQYVMEKDLTAN